MLYALLIYGSVADWTEEQQAAVLDRHASLRERLAREGRLGPVMRFEAGKSGAGDLLGLYVVDCGNDDISIGDEAVLIGSQDGESILATEWADRLGTIGYEIVCGISARIARRYTGA